MEKQSISRCYAIQNYGGLLLPILQFFTIVAEKPFVNVPHKTTERLTTICKPFCNAEHDCEIIAICGNFCCPHKRNDAIPFLAYYTTLVAINRPLNSSRSSVHLMVSTGNQTSQCSSMLLGRLIRVCALCASAKFSRCWTTSRPYCMGDADDLLPHQQHGPIKITVLPLKGLS